MSLQTLIKHLQGQHNQASHNPKKGKSAYYTGDYPIAGDEVDGREVLENVDNMDSIDASLYDYEIKSGIREVPMDHFSTEGMFYAKRDFDQSKELASRIQQSGKISPLIVVIDDQGPYVLEGAHRLHALSTLGAKSFPALVVVEQED